ncbi:hypothetical protein ACPOL_4405 [Acidisarcina polymorpha]|uniref:Uncharacterized protein n=1 Tax=Acidisarcina polymorpha TaxID=2211140 RepID=A0A2Z5G3J5_9BACT|nr:hypothetical protein ACPOL_4405 [Acidisarcina polymorpha]
MLKREGDGVGNSSANGVTRNSQWAHGHFSFDLPFDKSDHLSEV